jgi:hypothetical protein
MLRRAVALGLSSHTVGVTSISYLNGYALAESTLLPGGLQFAVLLVSAKKQTAKLRTRGGGARRELIQSVEILAGVLSQHEIPVSLPASTDLCR